MNEELFEKWKEDYLAYKQSKSDALINAGELTQRRMKAAFLAGMEAQKQRADGDTSDGYHTFNELYDHRCHLFVMIMCCRPEQSWRADKNDDGSKWSGWFTAGMNLSTGTITYHLPQWMWSMLDNKDIETFDIGPAWDGHTSTDVVKRLAAAIERG